ncbi:hypothetical protein Cgig2_001930 [Carnegiea gigantea]|uniref:Uncharacterized protein n=1 Tax=Carnegiea gigantea TaxID=171969 RepID=A0A9Q1K8D1_9CARY|nr:hypothetical protein Cgig2_001930 [Carnegiea gigantea]
MKNMMPSTEDNTEGRKMRETIMGNMPFYGRQQTRPEKPYLHNLITFNGGAEEPDVLRLIARGRRRCRGEEEREDTGMDPPKMTFEISYKSLLAKITTLFNLLPPIYVLSGRFEGVSTVFLKNEHSLISMVYQGVAKNTIVEAEESATLQVVTYFVKRYDITIYDVNWEVTIAYKKSAQLYKQQVQKLKSILAPSIYLVATINNSTLALAAIVMMNFMGFLEQIANKLTIKLNSYENVTLDNHHYQSCIMVECLGYVDQEPYILSDICKSLADAMQNAARKTLSYLQASYQFTVYDVNYEVMQTAWAQCCKRRKKCELLCSKIAGKDKGKTIVKYSG